MATKLTATRGKPVTYVPISSEAFCGRLRDAGVPEATADSLSELFALFATGSFAEPTHDVCKVLGREATDFDGYAQRIFA